MGNGFEGLALVRSGGQNETNCRVCTKNSAKLRHKNKRGIGECRKPNAAQTSQGDKQCISKGHWQCP